MFREMRRKDREIDSIKAAAILEAGEYGVLSTVGSNGYAYGIPLSYAYSNGSIYFHSATVGHKLDNISYNDKVSFCVVGATEVIPEDFGTKYESVVVFGKASEVYDEEKQEALMAIIKKYSSDFIENGKKYVAGSADKAKVIKIEIEHMTGKAKND
ncbi:MAG: pyridoxamine 5'-phosphate oxidase family protein [Clostridiaceae bacterium]|nr:pyridoxamine 5'-phosphate oxidase family protein [Clostridiaceae bacterium]